jgi:hypothetical protein
MGVLPIRWHPLFSFTDKMMKRLYPLFLCAAALVAAYILILSRETDYLAFVEQQSLFLHSPQFLQQHLAVAAGALCYVGAWFTEFLFQSWLGALLLMMWCALLMWLVCQAYKIPVAWSPLLLIPLGAVLLTDFTLGYWVYMIKMHGYFFAAVIGFSLAVAASWGYRAVRPWWLRLVVMALAVVVLYPLAGCYGLLAAVLMALVEWRWGKNWQQKAVTSAVALILVIAVPAICYAQLYTTAAYADIWRMGLPLFQQGETSYEANYLPYLVMALLLCLLAGFPLPSFGKKAKPWLLSVAHAVVVVAIGYTVWNYWYKNDNFHYEIQMERAVNQCDWQEIKGLYAQADNPTRQMVLYRYLALFKLGQAGEEMYSYGDSDERPDTPLSIPMVVTGGRPLYLHYGIPNFCYRWCVENGVEYGWRVDNLKYMLRCALLGNEWQAARKYVDLLKATRYHGSWAEHYEAMIGHPERIRDDGELGPVTHVLGQYDVLASDQTKLESFMIMMLSGMKTDDPVGADLALMAALQTKDIPTFWRAFQQYANLHQSERMPRYYQEAALLYGNLEHNVDISHMPFDDSVKETYQNFMKLASQCQGMSNEQMKAVFYPRFGNTFFYNYYLLRNLKTY